MENVTDSGKSGESGGGTNSDFGGIAGKECTTRGFFCTADERTWSGFRLECWLVGCSFAGGCGKGMSTAAERRGAAVCLYPWGVAVCLYPSPSAPVPSFEDGSSGFVARRAAGFRPPPMMPRSSTAKWCGGCWSAFGYVSCVGSDAANTVCAMEVLFPCSV